MELNGKDIKRFESKFVKSSGCWYWLAGKGTEGYGRFKIHRKTLQASRVAYSIYIGPIPVGLLVCHKCDNPGCVCPDHLFLGTHDDNMRDMAEKKRGLIGERNVNFKITEEQVEKIKRDKRSSRVIGAVYGVCKTTISRIKSGKRRNHAHG